MISYRANKCIEHAVLHGQLTTMEGSTTSSSLTKKIQYLHKSLDEGSQENVGGSSSDEESTKEVDYSKTMPAECHDSENASDDTRSKTVTVITLFMDRHKLPSRCM
jgi:hypothetical protein